MFSIVIPTMQKDTEILNKLIEELVLDDFVGEVIIIDNSLKGFLNPSNKVRTIVPKENLFVNASWNLGVKESKFDFIGVLNDDILMPKNLISSVHEFLKTNPEAGLVGLDSKFIQNFDKKDFETYPNETEIEFVKLNEAMDTLFWGSAFFGDKKNYHNIPENIKIWCGDNFLLKMNKDNNKTNYEIKGAQIKHLKSLTCASKKFDKIKVNDICSYAKIDPDFKKHPLYKSFGTSLFSVRKNEERTILTILGLKFKIRNKKVN